MCDQCVISYPSSRANCARIENERMLPAMGVPDLPAYRNKSQDSVFLVQSTGPPAPCIPTTLAVLRGLALDILLNPCRRRFYDVEASATP